MCRDGAVAVGQHGYPLKVQRFSPGSEAPPLGLAALGPQASRLVGNDVYPRPLLLCLGNEVVNCREQRLNFW